MSTSKNSLSLDVDPSILENKLLLKDLPEDDSFDSLLASLQNQHAAENTPSKLIMPSPGFCLKTRRVTGEKFFINVCHTEHIPIPEDLSDAELIQILSSDEPSTFRVPISIGELRTETDKEGSPCEVCDVGVHTEFLRKIEKNNLFHNFFITVAIEGIMEKYKLELSCENTIILKNRKVFGTLHRFRIQERPVRTGQPKCLIEEVTSSSTESEPLIDPVREDCQFQILKDPPFGEPEHLTVNVFIKGTVTSKELLLDVGEDRLLLRTASNSKRPSLLDIFLPFLVEQDSCRAQFNTDTRVLTVKMPIAAA